MSSRKIKYNFKVRVFKTFLGFFKILKIDFDRFYNYYLFENDLANKQLRLHKSNDANYYLSHVPDRYSMNFLQYKQETNFLNYSDLDKWTHGNMKNNSGDIGRFFFLNLCLDYLLEENISGNVAEIGVFKGNSAFLFAKYSEKVNSTCYLFDTFEGFDVRDLQGVDSEIDGNLFSNTSLEDVKKIVNNDSVVYVKGYFPESLSQVGELDSFSLVHVDCDLEKPIAECLDYFYPRMKKGGFLIMHDHSSLFWPGAKNAINSFFANKPEFVMPIPDKSGTCVVRKI